MVLFGPKNNIFNDNVMVYNGFNSSISKYNVFYNLLHNIKSFFGENLGYFSCTAAYSLGGAQLLLIAIVFLYYFPNRFI